jgi:hypothetical protein
MQSQLSYIKPRLTPQYSYLRLAAKGLVKHPMFDVLHCLFATAKGAERGSIAMHSIFAGHHVFAT